MLRSWSTFRVSELSPAEGSGNWCGCLGTEAGAVSYVRFWNVKFCCLVAKLYLILHDPTDCSMQASLPFTISWILLKLMSTESVMPSNHLILCHLFLLLFSIFPYQGLFQWVRSSPGGQNIKASTSASVLPMNIQEWFSLGWMGWISLQSKGLSQVFSSTAAQFFGAQPSFQPPHPYHNLNASLLWLLASFMVQLSYPYMTTGKTTALSRRTFVGKFRG